MALTFDDATHDHIAHGSSTELDNVPIGTFAVWIRTTDVANTFRTFMSKSEARFLGDGPVLYRRGADGQTFAITAYRATASQNGVSTQVLTANTWQFLVGTWDITNGGPKVYRGTLTSPAVDVTDGGPSGDGSGAQVNDSALGVYVGDNGYAPANGQYAPPGDIAFAAMFNTDLTLEQVIAQQFNLQYPVAPSNCVLFCNYGFNGTAATAQPDWSGNGNHGTPSGVALANHVPIAIAPLKIHYVPSAVGPTYTLTAETGTFTQSGQTSDTLFNRLIAAAQGGFTLSGQDGALLLGRLLAAAQGSFSLTGQNAGLLLGRLLAAGQGSFTLSGQAADLLFNRLLAAEQGSYTLTGQDADFFFGYLLSAAQGSYTLAGQDTGLLFGRLLTAVQGTFTLSGQTTGLLFNRLLDAEQGSYTLTGQNANLLFNRLLAAAQGSFTLNGQITDLVYSGDAADYTLVADQGSIGLSGQAAGLLVNRLLTAAQGGFTLTGQAADLLRGFHLDAGQGAFVLSGQDATALINRILSADQGAFTVTGIAVGLNFSGEVIGSVVEVQDNAAYLVVITDNTTFVVALGDRSSFDVQSAEAAA